MGRPAQQGMTLAELMAAVGIAVIVSLLAVPLLGAARDRQRLLGHGLLLLNSVHQARAEALRRNQPVFLCAANLKTNLELQGCQPVQPGSQQVWREGGLVYADKGMDNASYDGGERLRLAMFDRERVRVQAPVRQLTLLPEGRVEPEGGLVFQLRSGSRCLAVSVAADGRAALGGIADDCA